MKSVLLILSILVIMQQKSLSQELVASLQPTTFINIKGYQLINDSITRYFLTSDDSKFTSNDQVYIVDFNHLTKELDTRVLIDSQQYSLAAAFEIFLLPLFEGQSIVGSNGFECDITIADLLFLEKNGSVSWHLGWNEILANEFITSIGLVKKDVIIINTNNLPIYLNINGDQEFFNLDPEAFYNVIKIKENYYGTNDDNIFKLNKEFEIIESIGGDSVSYFQQVDVDKFLVGTAVGTAIIDTHLNVVSSTFSVQNIVSGARSGDQFWVIDEEALHLLDADLMIDKTIMPEPREEMKYVSVFNDTAYVVSEYNGIHHKDFVMRKYVRETTLPSASMNVSIESIQMPDTILREIWNGLPYAFTLRFDSLGIDVFNHSVDTIHSLNINVDWSSEIWCLSYHRQWDFDELEILPQQMATLQLEPFITDVMYYGAPPQFCFWVDFANQQPDIYPDDNLLCGDAEIINKTIDPAQVKDFLIYPNPADEIIYVSSKSNDKIDRVNIYNCQVVLLYSVEGNNDIMEVPVEFLPPGMYLVGIEKRDSYIQYEKLIRK